MRRCGADLQRGEALLGRPALHPHALGGHLQRRVIIARAPLAADLQRRHAAPEVLQQLRSISQTSRLQHGSKNFLMRQACTGAYARQQSDAVQAGACPRGAGALD